jgi:thermitase
MARRATWWGVLLLGFLVAALVGCSLLETATGPGEDSIVGEPGLVAGLEDGDLWVAKDAYAGLETQPQEAAEGPQFVPGQLIVKFRAGQYSDANVNSLATKYALKTSGKNKSLRLALVTVPAGTSLDDMTAKLEADPKVETVGLNILYWPCESGQAPVRPEAITNDEEYWNQWALWWIGYSCIPTSAMPASAPGIAVIDTGVDYTHPDITAAKVIMGPDYYDGDMDPKDVYGHGTHVAGIAAALTGNNLGVAGVSGKSKILAIRVGYYWIPTFAAAAGITYAADNPSVKVINCSWGGYGTSTFIADAVNYATVTKGKLLVAAAGNDDSTSPLYPSAYPNVLSVGATYYYDKTDFSNYGSTVDIAAPGEDILSTVPYSWDPSYPYESWGGTSMASPLVAGAAALVWGKWPTMTAADVQNLLKTSGWGPIDPDSHAHSFGTSVLYLDLWQAFYVKGAVLSPATGAILGRVVDASIATDAGYLDDPNPGLAGATVTAKKVVGGTIKTATTRADGSYTITDLLQGEYTLSVSRPGYCTTPGITTVWVSGCDLTFDEQVTCFALPKTQLAGTYTVVVQWCNWWDEYSLFNPYLWLPDTLPDRQQYRVSPSDPGILNVHPYARLLRATESGYAYDDPLLGSGPVVADTTVFKGAYTGTYRFAVYDSYWFWNDDWETSHAVVRLYDGATFKRAFTPTSTSIDEDWWPVFELSRPTGTIVAGFPTLGYYYPSPYPGPYALDAVGAGTSKVEPTAPTEPRPVPFREKLPERRR